MDIMGIILIGVLVGIAIGIILLCIYFCTNATPSSESKRNRDIESGLLNQDPEAPDIHRTEEKEVKSDDEKKITIRKLIGRNKNDVLSLEILYAIETPDILFNKHVVNGDITAKRAIDLSVSRGEDFAKEHKRNTVLENPQYFDCCVLQNSEQLGTRYHRAFIARNPVRTYQCDYDLNSKTWKSKDLGWKYPAIEKHSNAYHFLYKSLNFEIYK